ncbi:MAG: zinc-dependent alcohol dehydrogenase [Promethearchaeota archaeon]
MFEDVRKVVVHDDYPDPVAGPGEALIRVHYCAICGTDVKNWLHKIYQCPLVMGHEFAGEVVGLGEGMEDSGFRIGDRATGINVLLDTTKKVRGLGIFDDGGFAELVRVPRDFLFHVPDGISLRDATMIESFAVAVRGVNWANVQRPHNVVVIGAGNIGLTTLSLLQTLEENRAPNYVLVVEPQAFNREKAIKLGATAALPPSKAKIRKFCKQHGNPDLIFEAAGNEKAILLAVDVVDRGGTIVMESVQKGKISFPIFMLSSKEIGLRGSLSHTRGDIEAAIDLIASGRVKPDKIISEVIPLGEIQSGFERYIAGGEREFVKLVVRVKE